ncbi:TNF receptor-associated factor 6 [Rhipicephalus sanguineus]|nr:TNF receptor-associated factor 6 [Rhipicephalus sanguineus]
MGQTTSSHKHGECGSSNQSLTAASTFNPFLRSSTASDRDTCRSGYMLKGFDSPILRPERRVSFVQRLSKHRVCVLCREVPSRVIPLPCEHVGCYGCVAVACRSLKDKRRPVCPDDGATLVIHKVRVVDNSDHLFQKTVLCLNSPFGCPHQCKLEELQGHCEECQFTLVTCELCEKDVRKCDYKQHYEHCSQRNPAGGLAIHQ